MRTKKIFLRFSFGILLAIPFLFGAAFSAYATRSDISAPAFPSPANGWPTDTFILQWANSTFPQGSFSTGYLVEFAKVPSIPPANDNIENISWEPHWTPTNSFTLPNTVAVDQQYMWRVRGCLASILLQQGNTGDMSVWCGPWSSQDSAVTIAGVPIKGAWTFTPKLGKPTLVSPQNGGSSVIAKGLQGNPSVELKWNKVPGASAYAVSINSRSFDISAPSSNPDQVSAWVPSNISIVPATTYQWNVTASQGTAVGSQSDSWTFSTSLSQTAPIFPKQGGTIPFAQNITFKWETVPGADGYVFQLFDSLGNNLIKPSDQSVTQPSFSLGTGVKNSFEPGKQYTWKIMPSYNGLSSSLASGPWNFTVVFAAPTNLSPNSINILSLSPSFSKYAFSWDAPLNFAGTVIQYKWEILNKASIMLSGQALSNSTYIDLTRLTGGDYTWHVLACGSNNMGCGDWSAPANFTIPVAPAISSFGVKPVPPQWANKASPLVSISWSMANTEGFAIDHYELWRAPDLNGIPKPNGWIKVTSLNGGGQSNSNLPSDATHTTDSPNDGIWWYGFHAIDVAGNCIAESGVHCGGVQTDSLDTRKAVGPLKVQVDRIVPSVPSVPALSTLSNPPAWQWGASSDNGSGIAKYNVQWCTDQTFKDKSCASNSAVVQAPSTAFTQPVKVAAGDWYLRVQAVDVAGNESGFSSPGHVKIEVFTPPPPISPPTTPPAKAAIGESCTSNSDCQTSLVCEIPEERIISGLSDGFCAQQPSTPYIVTYPPKNGSLAFQASSAGQSVQNTFYVMIDSGAPSQDNKINITISGDSAFTFASCDSFSAECNNQNRTIKTTLQPGGYKTYGVTFTPTSLGSATGQLYYTISGVQSGPSDSGYITLQGTVGAQPGALGGVTAPTGGQQGPCPPGAVCIGNPLSSGSFPDLVNTILDFIFNLALAVVPVMVIVAGFLFLTGGGDPAKLTRARDILLWTAVGFGIILISKGIPLVIKDILGAK